MEINPPQIPYYVLDHNGTIFNSMPLRIVSSCNMDIFKFPFDTQICSLSFGSYVYTVDDLIMLPRANSTKVTEYSRKIFASKGDWNLVGISVQNQTYETEGDWYNQVIYKIMIKRAPVVYVINLIVPACLMVLLDIFSMFIQIGTGERLGFKITIILGFSVLLLILNNLLPNSDSPPVLGIFCCVCLAVMVFSIIGSIVISYMLSLSDTQPNVPPWIRIWILKHLARVLCFRSKPMQEDYVTAVDNAVSKSSEDIKKAESQKELQEQRKDTPRNTKGKMEVKLLKMLLVEVLKIHQDLANTKNESDAKSDWHHAALVVDRLILIVYLFTVVIIFAIVVIVWTS
ncbi:5-hydroxytryptamine receptor 3A-like [Discoglossus pictus]